MIIDKCIDKKHVLIIKIYIVVIILLTPVKSQSFQSPSPQQQRFCNTPELCFGFCTPGETKGKDALHLCHICFLICFFSIITNSMLN